MLGLRVSDLIGQEGIEAKHLIPYTYPTDEELQRVGVTGLFLGHYIPWDGLSNTLISQANGFQTYHKVVEGSMVNYENLDNHHTGIHDYFKFLKFGFGRATDLACLHIRRGRLTRQDGVGAVKRLDGLFPWEYLGKPLKIFCCRLICLWMSSRACAINLQIRKFSNETSVVHWLKIVRETSPRLITTMSEH